MNKITQKVVNIFELIFSRKMVSYLARKEGFAKRKVKALDPFSFILALTFGRQKKSAPIN